MISVNEIIKGKCLLYMVSKMIIDIYIGFCIYIYKVLFFFKNVMFSGFRCFIFL